MQVQKENIVNRILEVSKKEFVKSGFQKTSMRKIAKESGVGLSNIYNYFDNKDQIFERVLKPLLEEFDRVNAEHNSPEHITDEVFYSDEYQKNNIKMLIELVENFRTELDLLFFKSQGSLLANYKEILIEEFTRLGIEYIKKMEHKYPRLNSNISEFFIHNVSAWWVNILIEIVMHEMDDNEIEEFASEYVQFTTAGWKKLMNA